jgi:hypothetical protein
VGVILRRARGGKGGEGSTPSQILCCTWEASESGWAYAWQLHAWAASASEPGISLEWCPWDKRYGGICSLSSQEGWACHCQGNSAFFRFLKGALTGLACSSTHYSHTSDHCEDRARGQARNLAEVHGNRTHLGPPSQPHTGFEVREPHQ